MKSCRVVGQKLVLVMSTDLIITLKGQVQILVSEQRKELFCDGVEQTALLLCHINILVNSWGGGAHRLPCECEGYACLVKGCKLMNMWVSLKVFRTKIDINTFMDVREFLVENQALLRLTTETDTFLERLVIYLNALFITLYEELNAQYFLTLLRVIFTQDEDLLGKNSNKQQGLETVTYSCINKPTTAGVSSRF